jgi:beta-1,4-mannosyl-glycoprotein beta-1,4-N-acetylglucosaminyltransferase
MIVDCFTFFNELDLLEIRLNELGGVVDKFVIVEAELTQSLLPKPLHFEENRWRYGDFLHKIVHVKMTKDECPSNDSNAWAMENAQRNKIFDGVQSLYLSDDDIVLISDLDEIPSSKAVGGLETALGQWDICSIEMGFYAYFLNLKAQERDWVGSVATKYKLFKEHMPQDFRKYKDAFNRISGGGWHFSWLGGYNKIYEKSLSCIEPFDKSKIPTIEQFKRHFEGFTQSDNKFFIHLENLQKHETKFIKVEIDKSYPKVILNNLNFYKKFILE